MSKKTESLLEELADCQKRLISLKHHYAYLKKKRTVIITVASVDLLLCLFLGVNGYWLFEKNDIFGWVFLLTLGILFILPNIDIPSSKQLQRYESDISNLEFKISHLEFQYEHMKKKVT